MDNLGTLHAARRDEGDLAAASYRRAIELAEAEAISWRAPYQSSLALRKQINRGDVDFVDMHLSHVPQSALFGFFGNIDFAVIEATDVTSDGRVYLTTSIGASPAFLQAADNVIIEVNRSQSRRVAEMADIVVPKPPPYRPAIDLDHPLERIGKPYARVDPEKVIAVVETDEPDEDLPEFDVPTIPGIEIGASDPDEGAGGAGLAPSLEMVPEEPQDVSPEQPLDEAAEQQLDAKPDLETAEEAPSDGEPSPEPDETDAPEEEDDRP